MLFRLLVSVVRKDSAGIPTRKFGNTGKFELFYDSCGKMITKFLSLASFFWDVPGGRDARFVYPWHVLLTPVAAQCCWYFQMPEFRSGARKFVKCCQHWKAIESAGHDLNWVCTRNDRWTLFRRRTNFVCVCVHRPFKWLACSVQWGHAFKILGRKPLVTRLFRKHMGGWKDNIKTDLTERALIFSNRVCEQDDLAGYVKTGNVLTWWETVYAVCHGVRTENLKIKIH